MSQTKTRNPGGGALPVVGYTGRLRPKDFVGEKIVLILIKMNLKSFNINPFNIGYI